MRKAVYLFLIVMLGCVATCWAQKGGIEIVDPKVAAEDPDFHVQGEYVGELTGPDGGKQRVGVQVVARGDGNFDIYLLEGGLPGDGWHKGDKRVQASGKREAAVTTIEGDASGKIEGETMTLQCSQTGAKGTLRRVERTSPTLGDRAPKGAKVLYKDAGDADRFEAAEVSDDGNLVAGITTKDKFNSYKLHLEFRLSWKPQATGQARSNSGVYLHDCYEVQVLDSFGLEGKDNECGGLYKVKEPDVNMCLPPLVWQTYDVEFTAPEYAASGEKTKNARLSVRHNGVVIHNHVELPQDTPGRLKEGPGPRPIHLQGHGNRVQYRNIWLVPQ